MKRQGGSQRRQVSRGEKVILFFQKHHRLLASSTLILFLGLYLYPDLPNTSLLKGLKEISESQDPNTKVTQENSFHHIGIGWNTNVDLVVDSTELFKQLKLKVNIAPKDYVEINSMNQFEQVFKFFFQHSAAGERHVTDSALFEKILKESENLSKKTYRPGGNAALMANQFANDGHQVILGGPIGKQLRNHLHENITVASSNVENNQKDETHLILEYSTGSTFDGLTATRGNRFILTKDDQNSQLSGIEPLNEAMVKAEEQRPLDLFVVSGINILEGLKPIEKRSQRLEAVMSSLKNINSSTPIHLEIASMGDLAFFKDVVYKLFPLVDSIGLNEQELMSLYEVMDGKFAEMIRKEDMTGNVPKPSVIQNVLEFVLRQFSPELSIKAKQSDNNDSNPSTLQRGLRRIHLHSFGYHLIAQTEIGGLTTVWRSGKTAVARGSVIATTSACEKDINNLDEDDLEIIMPQSFYVNTTNGVMRQLIVDAVTPVAEWEFEVISSESIGKKKKKKKTPNRSVRYFLAPVATCKKPKQTVGLGDAISAAALSFSL